MYEKYTKRIIDLSISVILLFYLLPLCVIIAIFIKLNSKGPSIFKQQRTGKNGSIFYMYKFRTMSCDNDVMDKNKPNEITRIGKAIRYLSLDELPQLINVIKGDMSLIGPRPWIPEYYKHMTAEQRKRNSIRPGITGLAQIKGRNSISVLEKINYDLSYLKNICLKNDIKIIILTIIAILNKKGVAIEKTVIHKEIDDLKCQSSNINYSLEQTQDIATVPEGIYRF